MTRMWLGSVAGQDQAGDFGKYVLVWYDEQSKERWEALGHVDGRKAERQRT